MEILLGERSYRHDLAHYLLVTVEVPYTGRIVEAPIPLQFQKQL